MPYEELPHDDLLTLHPGLSHSCLHHSITGEIAVVHHAPGIAVELLMAGTGYAFVRSSCGRLKPAWVNTIFKTHVFIGPSGGKFVRQEGGGPMVSLESFQESAVHHWVRLGNYKLKLALQPRKVDGLCILWEMRQVQLHLDLLHYKEPLSCQWLLNRMPQMRAFCKALDIPASHFEKSTACSLQELGCSTWALVGSLLYLYTSVGHADDRARVAGFMHAAFAGIFKGTMSITLSLDPSAIVSPGLPPDCGGLIQVEVIDGICQTSNLQLATQLPGMHPTVAEVGCFFSCCHIMSLVQKLACRYP
jgi:hypothetical protein